MVLTSRCRGQVGCRCESVGADDGGKTAGPQGEHGVSVKTIAQGRLGSSGCTCGSCPVHSCSHGGHGRQPTLSLPCALDLARDERRSSLGRTRREDDEACPKAV
ncbi:Protein of unknown function [Bradyrhizobium sp. ORS 285]|nr:Protein of unknown function [Bradyrhizobium sp. ORS 285]